MVECYAVAFNWRLAWYAMPPHTTDWRVEYKGEIGQIFPSQFFLLLVFCISTIRGAKTPFDPEPRRLSQSTIHFTVLYFEAELSGRVAN